MKHYILILTLIISKSTLASFYVHTGTGAYLGEKYLGLSWESENQNHFLDLNYGITQEDVENQIDQMNMKYTYFPITGQMAPFTIQYLGLTVQVSRWQSDEAFFDSPDRYNDKYYYQQTRYRSALGISNQLRYKKIIITTDVVFLDQKLITYYNNDDENIWHFINWGLGLKIEI